MELIKCKYRIRCELGACGNRADYTVLPAKAGVRSCLHICGDCLCELASLCNRMTEPDGREAKR